MPKNMCFITRMTQTNPLYQYKIIWIFSYFFTIVTVWETTARQLAKGEWKFRVASKIHFILAGLASNSCKASRNLKTLVTITGYIFKIS